MKWEAFKSIIYKYTVRPLIKIGINGNTEDYEIHMIIHDYGAEKIEYIIVWGLLEQNYEPKHNHAVTMLAKGTDMLSSTPPSVGRDSMTVATKATKATLPIVEIKSIWKYPRAEK